MLYIIVFAALVIEKVQAQSSNNGTNECPNVQGFFYQDNCKLLCQKAKWTDVVVFYLGNYIAHAATITTRPGQSTFVTVMTIIGAVLLPGTGIWNGLKAIRSLAKLEPTELRTAARAGALYAVVRDDNHSPDLPSAAEGAASLPASTTTQISQQQHEIENHLPEDPSPRANPEISNRAASFSTRFLSTSIHGLGDLPEGYYLMQIRQDAVFEGEKHVPKETRPWYNLRRLVDMISRCIWPQPSGSTPTLSCNYNLVGALASIVQLFFAISTLYRTRGNQIERYGHAAFGLTVVPYAWMSLINLAGNALCPQYDNIYIVRSQALQDPEKTRRDDPEHLLTQERRPWQVDGTVGVLAESEEKRLRDDFEECSATGSRKSQTRRMALWPWMINRFKLGSLLVDNSRQGAKERTEERTKNANDHSNQLNQPDFKSFIKLLRQKTSLQAIFSWGWGQIKTPLLSPEFVGYAYPLALVGGLSGFQPGESELFQRVWIMMWLICGSAVGLILGQSLRQLGNKSPNVYSLPMADDQVDPLYGSLWVIISSVATYGAVSVGGYVVVARMLLEFANCVEVDS